ncbi:hypothetical protein ACGFI9_37100 [Micromonospora sp. NPDC048930]|uniref:hypothetical protein n=1 Tax=Micromonospora sp. NPDC048930 TaxID=3364261 RepID=UPI0037142A50
MHHRKMIIAGCVAGVAALALIAVLAFAAYRAGAEPLTTRFAVLCVADIVLWITSIRLIGDGITGQRIERRTSGHVEGVRETVDRLAAALPKAAR